jgi:hypothetical protein
MAAKKVLTRQELYDLVWTEPARTVAAAYGVSDVWLKKVCAKADIPSPDRGYWAKLAAGKPVVRSSAGHARHALDHKARLQMALRSGRRAR